MRSNTEQIEIAAPAGEVFDYVADAEKLPFWATGFAKAVRPIRAAMTAQAMR